MIKGIVIGVIGSLIGALIFALISPKVKNISSYVVKILSKLSNGYKNSVYKKAAERDSNSVSLFSLLILLMFLFILAFSAHYDVIRTSVELIDDTNSEISIIENSIKTLNENNGQYEPIKPITDIEH